MSFLSHSFTPVFLHWSCLLRGQCEAQPLPTAQVAKGSQGGLPLGAGVVLWTRGFRGRFQDIWEEQRLQRHTIKGNT